MIKIDKKEALKFLEKTAKEAVYQNTFKKETFDRCMKKIDEAIEILRHD